MLFSRARARLHALRSTAAVFLGGALSGLTARWIERWLSEREREDPSFVRGNPTDPVAWGAFAGIPPVVLRGQPDGRGATVVSLDDDDAFLPRSFVALAQAWKKDRQEARNLAQLPFDADGPYWAFAGPIMFRELWLVQYVLIAVLGVEPQLASALGKRILNEWHDLEPEAGLTDDEKALLRMEREEQRA